MRRPGRNSAPTVELSGRPNETSTHLETATTDRMCPPRRPVSDVARSDPSLWRDTCPQPSSERSLSPTPAIAGRLAPCPDRMAPRAKHAEMHIQHGILVNSQGSVEELNLPSEPVSPTALPGPNIRRQSDDPFFRPKRHLGAARSAVSQVSGVSFCLWLLIRRGHASIKPNQCMARTA